MLQGRFRELGELVSLTVDDRAVSVPKGTGLVEAALAAGIEIPVFCYEPRLGPPIGACRMCLVEIEGIPKLQAGCTLTASEGMVVRTALTSPKAADGQEATLEFILVNHPLDCPVCDKGGECPLQDLTFRYGPGNTRMTFPKITFDKPIPVSPLIALDRERCILCYRCTRFSEEVAEDGQLIARNRGARTEIATFEDEPYRSVFSGNVIELCPVGALTSSLYRFEGRPWEINNVPTVCTGCAVGCNTSATIREGKVKRILSRNHPEVDRGWLCDKGRFTYPHLRARDRIVDPLRRGQRGLAEVSWDEAVDAAEEMLREAEGAIVTAFSGSETNEIAYALGRLLRQGVGAHSAVLPEATSVALDAFRLPLSAIAQAELVVVIGDDPVVERAPIVDLWIKEARRRGAERRGLLADGRHADRADGRNGRLPRGRAARKSARRAPPRLRPRGADLVRARRRRRRADLRARARARLRRQARLRRVPPPGDAERQRCRGRLVGRRGRGRGEPGADQAAARVRRRRCRGPERARARRGRGARHRRDDVPRARGRLGRPDPARDRSARAGRHGREPRGPSAAAPARRAPPCPDELAWISKLAERFDVEVSPHASLVFAELARHLYADLELEDLDLRAGLPARKPYVAPEIATTPAPAPLPGDELRLHRYRPLVSGPAVERVRELEFLRPDAEVELSAADAERRGISNGDAVVVRSNGTSVELRARLNRRLVSGVARIAEEHAGELHASVEVVKS